MKKIEEVNTTNSKKQQELTKEVQNLATAPKIEDKNALSESENKTLGGIVSVFSKGLEGVVTAVSSIRKVFRKEKDEKVLNKARYQAYRTAVKEWLQKLNPSWTEEMAKTEMQSFFTKVWRDNALGFSPNALTSDSESAIKQQKAREKKKQNEERLLAKSLDDLESDSKKLQTSLATATSDKVSDLATKLKKLNEIIKKKKKSDDEKDKSLKSERLKKATDLLKEESLSKINLVISYLEGKATIQKK